VSSIEEGRVGRNYLSATCDYPDPQPQDDDDSRSMGMARGILLMKIYMTANLLSMVGDWFANTLVCDWRQVFCGSVGGWCVVRGARDA
jgi:hypothetical protein